MYKYKKSIIKFLTIIYLSLFIIEFIKYMFIDCNLYGLIYLIINLIIIFLLIPVVYNYNRYYSIQRISKLFIILIFGIFNSYFLYNIVTGSINYTDASYEYNQDIYIYKNIIKGIVYILLFIFTIFEFKLDKLIKKINDNQNKGKKTNKKVG